MNAAILVVSIWFPFSQLAAQTQVHEYGPFTLQECTELASKLWSLDAPGKHIWGSCKPTDVDSH